jgi:hypothetical protein
MLARVGGALTIVIVQAVLHGAGLKTDNVENTDPFWILAVFVAVFVVERPES